MVSVNNGTTWSATYNAFGQRVERISGCCGRTEELFDPAGNLLGHLNGANGIWWEEYVPFDGRLLWYYTQASNVSRYFHVHALGSLGLATDQTGAPVEAMLHYPFGDRWQNTTGFGWDEKFAQFSQRDEDLQMYEADFREYNPGLGRWMTPDPIGGDVTNPQSFNRYAYVLNNPTTLTDPSGPATPPALRGRGYQQFRAHCLIYPACARWATIAGTNAMGWDIFDLMEIPVVADTYSSARLLSTINFGAMHYANGYATSVSLYFPGGYTASYVGDAFTFFSGWGANASFLRDFLTNSGASDRYYGPYSRETQSLMNSQFAHEMTAFNKAQGCAPVLNFNRSTQQGADQIFTDFGNPTQIPLGAAHAAITNYNGLATYTVMNTASVNSFLYHSSPASWNHNVGPVPGRNIYQVFHWSEASPCD